MSEVITLSIVPQPLPEIENLKIGFKFQEILEDDDDEEARLVDNKSTKDNFWSSKKISVDSIQGLDDFKTKSFDETWISGQFKFVPCKQKSWTVL